MYMYYCIRMCLVLHVSISSQCLCFGFSFVFKHVLGVSIVRHNNHCPVDGKPLSNKRPALNCFFF